MRGEWGGWVGGWGGVFRGCAHLHPEQGELDGLGGGRAARAGQPDGGAAARERASVHSPTKAPQRPATRPAGMVADNGRPGFATLHGCLAAATRMPSSRRCLVFVSGHAL